MRVALTFVLILICRLLQIHASYIPLLEYTGTTFFDRWEFYGNMDNTTWGNVSFVDKQSARTQRLVYTNSQGNAIIKVDNMSTIPLSPMVRRNTVKISSIDSYSFGTLVIIDVIHLPYGCSESLLYSIDAVHKYPNPLGWPNGGEIDIIEGINGMNSNQITLHALPGCMKTEIKGQQTGITLETNCSSVKGCTVKETKPNSYGPGFAQAGGGVYAMQFSRAGIYIWFWSRPDIPASIKNATSVSRMDTSVWGIPTASYPSTQCDFSYYFPPQNLVLITTLCGAWAGDNATYLSTCNGTCVANNIVGSGNNYAQAYWEIKYIRTYYDETIGNVSPSPSYMGPSSTPTSDSPFSRPLIAHFIVALGCFLLVFGMMLS